MGLKVLKQPKKGFGGIDIPGENGGIYIAGQRFEYDGDYDGLQGAVIFLKEKPPKEVLDPSRDRTTLNQTDLRNISEWLCQRYDLSKEARLYSSTLAEAITDGGTSKGFWIDRNYLDSANFSDVLETALHEISHKVGADETMEFSYKLTNVNQRVIQQILEEPITRNELQALGKLWKEYTTPAATV